MVLQQPWHDSTIPLKMASRDPTCICGYIREDLMEFVGADVQKPVGRKMLFYCTKNKFKSGICYINQILYCVHSYCIFSIKKTNITVFMRLLDERLPNQEMTQRETPLMFHYDTT